MKIFEAVVRAMQADEARARARAPEHDASSAEVDPG